MVKGDVIDAEILEIICQLTGACRCQPGKVVQKLWSGYGVIQKVTLIGDARIDAVVKWVDLSKSRVNRRGWSGSTSHDRKVRSYEVEKNFYQHYGARCHAGPRVPALLGAMPIDDGAGWVMVLEDLDAAGFSIRKTHPSSENVRQCVDWIADFHAAFLGDTGARLWQRGTYWHLQTRPDEYAAMAEGPLKRSAVAIDRMLSDCQYQTLVHGDAKIANFCFADDGNPAGGQKSDDQATVGLVAAVDFQYVGRGCGMQDLVYLLTSCLSDEACERQWESILDQYFRRLGDRLGDPMGTTDASFSALEQQWRRLFPVAWADFNRFLNGWSPGHWKLTPFSQRMTDEALAMLGD